MAKLNITFYFFYYFDFQFLFLSSDLVIFGFTYTCNITNSTSVWSVQFACWRHCSGKQSTDDAQLSELSLKPGMKIMMMGTREEELAGMMEPPSTSVDVVNDFDIEDDEIAIQDRYTVHASGISMELFSGQRIIFTHFTKGRIGWCPPKKHCPYHWGSFRPHRPSTAVSIWYEGRSKSFATWL